MGGGSSKASKSGKSSSSKHSAAVAANFACKSQLENHLN